MGVEGKLDKKKKTATAKCKSSQTLIKAESKINYEILIHVFDEIFKSLSCWFNDIMITLQLKLSTDKDGAICKTQHLSAVCSKILQELSFYCKVHDL